MPREGLTSDIAILTRCNGKQFVLLNARLFASEKSGRWWVSYTYRNRISGEEDRKVLFGAGSSGRPKLIVFGLCRPKMNPKTKRAFPPDYVYDPYDRTPLVPAELDAPFHKVQEEAP